MERINGQYHKRFRKTWQGDPHTVYNPEVIKYMKSMGIQHLYMDTTGLGAPVYADLRKYLPESKITGVKFTTNSKADMVNNMVYLWEAGGENIPDFQIWTDHDKMLFDQLHQLRRTKTRTGVEKFTGKIDGKKDDLIWATALSLWENIEVLMGDFMVVEANYKENSKRIRYG